jgi:hypothetical protein
MTTKQPPKAEKGELDRTEWCFDSIPKPEIETCFIYEYARELARRSPKILDLLAQSKAGWSAPAKTPERYEARQADREFRKIMTACFPDFPGIYALHKIRPQNDKKRRARTALVVILHVIENYSRRVLS